MQTATSLGALNFALAGAREGFGPFLGVYLQQQGFDPAVTGSVMGLAGLAGLLATTPIGSLIDRFRSKRAGVAAAVAALAAGAVALVATNNLWLIAASQVVIGVADTSIAPLVAAISLGMVGQAAYGARVSHNEAFNHAGNAANAALSGVLGYALGLGYVAVAIVVMAVASCGVLLGIRPEAIDYATARGGLADERSALQVLRQTRPLIVLAATAFAFQTANGAMLPFLAQARTAAGANASITTGIMVVLAQITMIGAALFAGRFSGRRGLGRVMTIALAAVAVRGLLAAFGTSWLVVIPVQVLEGVAMGCGGVAIPALAAEIMDGTGHAGAGLGSVMTAYGAGAALSPIIAGFAAQWLGFSASFIALAAVAGLGLAVWIVGSRLAADSSSA